MVIDRTEGFICYVMSRLRRAGYHCSAKNKNWLPKQYNGSNWVDYTVYIPGDIDGDGHISIADATDLLDLILSGAANMTDYAYADVDGDGHITIADVTEIIDMLLNN